MDLKKKFGTDPKSEAEGIDVHLGDDAYITIARAGGANAAYQREMLRVSKANKRALQFDSMDPDEADKIMRGVLAQTVVLGWRGIELDGQPLGFSRENALRLFNEVPEVYRIVSEEANKAANFRAEGINEQGKASRPN